MTGLDFPHSTSNWLPRVPAPLTCSPTRAGIESSTSRELYDRFLLAGALVPSSPAALVPKNFAPNLSSTSASDTAAAWNTRAVIAATSDCDNVPFGVTP